MLFIFLTPELIRNPRQLKTAVFLHWCLIRAVPFDTSDLFYICGINVQAQTNKLVCFSKASVKN
jgi:hypothetical protein